MCEYLLILVHDVLRRAQLLFRQTTRFNSPCFGSEPYLPVSGSLINGLHGLGESVFFVSFLAVGCTSIYSTLYT